MEENAGQYFIWRNEKQKELVWLLSDVVYKFMEWFRYCFIVSGEV